MSLTQALNSAISGLNTAQARIAITSSNVANVNTEGYSRKIAGQEALTLNGVGAGVQIGDVTRNVNQGLLTELRGQLSVAGTASVRDDFYQRIQTLFGTPQSSSSVSQRISDMADAFEQLNDTPEQNSPKVQVIATAQQVVNSFDNLSSQIQKLRGEADDKISNDVDSANTLLGQISKLNSDIVRMNNLDQPTTELRDQRDQKVNQLSKLMNITTYTRGDGSMVIYTGNGTRPLLDRTPAKLTFNSTTGYEPGTSGSSISLDGVDISSEIQQGELRGLLDLRDKDLPQLNDQINELASGLKDAINAEHNKGTAFPPPTNLVGTRDINGTDHFAATGSFRIAALDGDGNLVSYDDIDLSTATSVQDVVDAINASSAGSDVQASIVNGKLHIEGQNGNRVAINELDSSVTLGDGRKQGISQFFGLNDFFTAQTNSQTLTSAPQNSSTTALGLTGTLTIYAGGSGPFTVNYAATDTMESIAANINAVAGVDSFVSQDGDRSRLTISGGTSNLFISDSGSLSKTLNMTEERPNLAGSLSVSSQLVNDTSRLSRGQLNADVYESGTAVADPSAAIPGLAQHNTPPTEFNLTLNGSFGSVNIKYDQSDANANSLDDIAAQINANATLTDNNITADVYFDSDAGGYKLRVQDADGDPFYLSDDFAAANAVSGNSLTSVIGLGIQYGVHQGDNSAASALAGVFEKSDIKFDAAGGLNGETTSITDYAAGLIGSNSTKASAETSNNQFQDTLATDLNTRIQNEAGVNLDEEMSDLITFQRSYSASAKVITTVGDMFDALLNAV